jgi:winged helix DNA-binding protein
VRDTLGRMDKDLLVRARWFSWRRQRLDRTCRGVEDCLQSVIGVSSHNPSGPLSLLARVPRLLKGAAVEGVIDTKRAARIPAMRQKIFMVPMETAPAILAATRNEGPYRSALRRAGIGDDAYKNLRRDVLLAAGFPKTVDEIHDALRSPPEDLIPVLNAMCSEGVLLRIKSPNIRSNDFTFAATKVWVGKEMKNISQTQALAWLAGEYLTAFGPVSYEDFAWWAAVKTEDAADALDAQDPAHLADGLMIHRRDERALDGTRPHLGRVSLLPKLDCYTMGYAPTGRARFVHPSLLPVSYDGVGNSLPLVLIEGEVHGTWSFRGAGDRITIGIQLYDSPGPRLQAALEDEANLVGGFLEASTVTIEQERLARPARRALAKAPPRKALKRASSKPVRRTTVRRRSRSGSSHRRTRTSGPRRNQRS